MDHIIRQASPVMLQQCFVPTSWSRGCLQRLQQCQNNQMMIARCQSGFPVITVPKLMQQKLEKNKKKEEKAKAAKHLEAIHEKSRKGNTDICIVQCRNPRLNHYQGQSYPRSTGVRLASQGWAHNRAKGDHFTICSRVDTAAEEQDVAASSFAELGLHSDIATNLRRMGIVTPTDIQRRAIPRLLAGSDTLVAAETGCGKTVAAMAPLLHRLLRQQAAETEQQRRQRQDETNRPRALIITPGRELASQIRVGGSGQGRTGRQDVVCGVAGDLPIQTRLLLGGRTKRKMERPSLLPMDVLVASFGALSKLNSVGILNLSHVRQVVLDEADTLLDDSFRGDVCRLLGRLSLRAAASDQPPGRVERGDGPGASLALLGATLPRDVDRQLDGLVLGELTRVTSARLHHLQPHVQQKFLRLGSAERADTLLTLCRQAAALRQPVIVFSNKTSTCDWISLYLNDHGVDCLNISGQQHYKLRQGRWHAFLAGEAAVLSCTDLVSRGLDSCQVQHVINFDFPWNTSDYIHRAGRVGRAGSSLAGTVTSFVSRPLDVEMVQRVEKAARTGEALWNVDANIKQIITKRMLRKEATQHQSRRRT